MNKKNLKIAVVTTVLVTVMAFAYAGWYTRKPQVAEVKSLTSAPKLKIDQAKLKLFERLYQTIDPNRKEFNLTGELTVTDGSDSTFQSQRLAYHYLREKDSFYFLLGQTETLNAGDLYVNVDHEKKQIMVSARKQVVSNTWYPSFDKLVAHLADEGYEVTDSAQPQAAARKVSIACPTHITCKEFSIYYDEEKQLPTSLFVRLSNFDDPLNTKKDKTITMTVKIKVQDYNSEKLQPARILQRDTEGHYVPVHAYQGYEVIELDRD